MPTVATRPVTRLARVEVTRGSARASIARKENRLFFKPIPPPYDPLEWAELPFFEKSQAVCRAWAMQGYGTPIAVYLVYVLKIAAYVGGWFYFCGFTRGMGELATFSTWWLRPEAFEKAIVFSMLFEVVGLGCGSGPLTGRYVPPIGGALYFLRPGTTKLPVFEGAKVIGSNRRSLLDVGLYAALLVALLGALCTAPDPRAFPVIACVAVLLGVLDKTIFLAARGEHYVTTIAIFALGTDFIPGAKAIQAALWFWAGVSKLNHHFPNVVGVMTSNNPFLRAAWMRRLMYRQFPTDLAPSRAAIAMGHAGTLLELAVPLVLLAGSGGTTTFVGLVLALLLHGFITSNVPMGVPLEWNVMMVYGAFFLFFRHADVSLFSMSLPVSVVAIFMGVALPLLGNLFPSRVPFLLAMRYYAGNWAYSVWFFKKGAEKKLERIKGSSKWIHEQLAVLYDRKVTIGVVGKVIAFRLMHLHGRLLSRLVPRAIDRFQDYEWVDGEIVAGLVLGWNFGDGHLHREQLLRAIQAQCEFEEGELRCIMVEAQPLGGATLHYRIVDAKVGQLEEGHAAVKELRELQPWGNPAKEEGAPREEELTGA